MRQLTCAAAAVLMATALACSPRDRRETASKVDSVAEDVREETREGAAEVREEAREARDYTFAQRNDFRRDVDLQLKKLDEQIAGIKRDTKRGVDHARDSLVVNMHAARKAVSRDLERLGAATESTWDEAKRNLNDSLSALDREVHRLLPDAKPMGGTGPN
jgi:archaellum component FlaC